MSGRRDSYSSEVCIAEAILKKKKKKKEKRMEDLASSVCMIIISRSREEDRRKRRNNNKQQTSFTENDAVDRLRKKYRRSESPFSKKERKKKTLS